MCVLSSGAFFLCDVHFLLSLCLACAVSLRDMYLPCCGISLAYFLYSIGSLSLSTVTFLSLSLTLTLYLSPFHCCVCLTLIQVWYLSCKLLFSLMWSLSTFFDKVPIFLFYLSLVWYLYVSLSLLQYHSFSLRCGISLTFSK